MLFGLVDLAIFLYPTLYAVAWPAVVGMVLVGFPGAAVVASRTTVMQHHSSDAQRGRIFALLFGIGALALALGAVGAGFLGETLGIVPVLACQGVGYVLAGVVVLVLLGDDDRN